MWRGSTGLFPVVNFSYAGMNGHKNQCALVIMSSEIDFDLSDPDHNVMGTMDLAYPCYTADGFVHSRRIAGAYLDYVTNYGGTGTLTNIDLTKRTTAHELGHGIFIDHAVLNLNDRTYMVSGADSGPSVWEAHGIPENLNSGDLDQIKLEQ